MVAFICFRKKGQMIVFFSIYKLIYNSNIVLLTFTTLLEYLAEDKLLFSYFPRDLDLTFQANCFHNGDNLHKISNPISWEK